jgi:Generalcontrol nonderepressible 1 (Gcn1) N-terminal
LGLLFLYLGVECQSLNIRRELTGFLADSSASFPELVNGVMVDAFNTSLSKNFNVPISKAETDEDVVTDNHQSRLSTIVLACASFGEDVDPAVRKAVLTKMIVFAHHRKICKSFMLICCCLRFKSDTRRQF